MIIQYILLLIMPELLFSFIISLKSFMKHGYLSLLYDSLTSLFLELALISEVLSYYVNMRIFILSRYVVLNAFLRTTFIVLGFISWIFSINYLTSNKISRLIHIVTFIGGGAVIASLFETDLFSSLVLAVVEIAGLALIGIVIARHLIFSMRQLRARRNMKYHWIYFLGTLTFLSGLSILIINGLLVYVSIPLVDFLEVIAIALLFTGYLGVMMISGLYPHMLLTTYIRPYSLFLVTTGGETFFKYSFRAGRERVDPELVGSAMTGISMMTSEIIGKNIPMRLIEHEAFYIIMAHGEKILGFLFTDKMSKILSESLDRLIKVIESKYMDYIGDIVLMDEKIQKEMEKDTEEAFYYLI